MKSKFFAIIAIIATSALLIGCETVDEANFDSDQEWTVVDKTHSEGHVYYTITHVNKVPITKPNFLPGSWSIKVSIEKNGRKVEKTIRVSEKEYNSYEIGDTYR